MNIAEEIQLLGFDTRSALKATGEGKIEEWVHCYLTTGGWANPAFSRGLKLEKRWWNGPIEVNLKDLSRCVGPEPGMEYPVTFEYWDERTRQMALTLTEPLAIPPLIVEYRNGELSVRDGNTRHGAMELLQWRTCWVIFWYTAESDYHRHQIKSAGAAETEAVVAVSGRVPVAVRRADIPGDIVP
jgi:hypothetical protein